MDKAFGTTATEMSEALSFINDLSAETDRAAVILSASKLDILLYQILQRYLLPCPSAGDDLFEGEGPLSTFRAKIDLSFRLGLIDGSCSRALHLIRRIRNDFAHELSEVTLNAGAHRDRIQILKAHFDGFGPYEFVRTRYLKGREALPSDDFRLVAAFLPVYLTLVLNSIRPVSALDIPFSIFRADKNQESEPEKK